jgi:hypothetical protein
MISSRLNTSDLDDIQNSAHDAVQFVWVGPNSPSMSPSLISKVPDVVDTCNREVYEGTVCTLYSGSTPGAECRKMPAPIHSGGVMYVKNTAFFAITCSGQRKKY